MVLAGHKLQFTLCVNRCPEVLFPFLHRLMQSFFLNHVHPSALCILQHCASLLPIHVPTWCIPLSLSLYPLQSDQPPIKKVALEGLIDVLMMFGINAVAGGDADTVPLVSMTTQLFRRACRRGARLQGRKAAGAHDCMKSKHQWSCPNDTPGLARC